MRIVTGTALAAVAVVALSACSRGSEAARNHADAAPSASSSGSYASGSSDGGGKNYVAARGDSSRGGEGSGGGEGGGYSDGGYRKREAVPSFHGEPMWSDNRRHTAEENAHYHCDKSGADIGAKGFDDCLTKVHAFLDHPPADAKTMTRSNGDKLVYDPAANMFAVARKDGAPRTFFKPREGADYWKEQQAEADNPNGYRSRRYGGQNSGSGSGGE